MDMGEFERQVKSAMIKSTYGEKDENPIIAICVDIMVREPAESPECSNGALRKEMYVGPRELIKSR